MSKSIKVFTIGFTEKTAEEFFEKLRAASIKRVVDVRLNNNSQFDAFSKRNHLPYFLKEILRVDYVEAPILAPTKALLDAYKNDKDRDDKDRWADYERDFNKLIAERRIEDEIDPAMLDGGCLLCSEPLPDNCHRRLVVEYLQRRWGNLEIKHIVQAGSGG